ncbi:hypothetical protein [Draconibacterium sediminis]|uniref:hypothetical protein n=1 Tax=Draconibacterium sediminis TaxID=1544798 RepID=UPI0026F0B4C0|nr:hypothetical protein [Draconibacterium sediminis]
MKIILNPVLILLLFLTSCSEPKSEFSEGQLPDSTLIAIRDGFDTRVADLFNEQKGKTLDETFRVNWNESLAHSYPRTTYAAVQFWLNENIDSANIALQEYGQYFIDKPDENRMNVGWHTEMALRLIEMYGTKGSVSPGLIKPETEKKVMEGIWTNVKGGMGQDPEQVNTMTENYTKESETWYINSSENLHAQSFTTKWNFALLAKEMPDFKDRKYNDGHTASWHYGKWTEYLKMYFTERAKKGLFIEMMSRDYNHKTLKGMFNIYDFSPDPELKRNAGNYLDLYFAYWGEEQINGVSGGGKSRLYQDVSPGTSEYGYLFFGMGEKPRFETTIISAMTTSYRPPLVVYDIVCDLKGRGIYEVRQRAMGLAEAGFNSPPIYHLRTDSGGIVRYSWCTPDFIIGTAMFEARPYEDWVMISSQNQSRGVIFADNTEAGILPQCEKIKNNRLYNSMWSVQEKGTQISQKLQTSRGAGRTMVWFSAEGLGKPIEDGGWIFTESAGAYAAVRVVEGAYQWEEVTKGTKGKWLVCANEYSPVILEVDQKSNFKSFKEFRGKVLGNQLFFQNNILKYTGIYGDDFTFYADYSKSPEINGLTVDYAPAKVYDSPFLQSDWNSGIVHIQKGTRNKVRDFN